MNYVFINNIDNYIREKHFPLINSIVIYQNDKLIFERYYNKFNEFSRHEIMSIWKSILSICIGICLDKGYIKSLDEPIMNYLEEFSLGKHLYHKKITIKHLLTMTSGIYWNSGIHYHCPMIDQMKRSKNWLEHISDINMNSLPGSIYEYKEWDVILLSAIIGKATKMTSFEFCNKYLYNPIGIKSGTWPQSDCGVCYGNNIDEGNNSDDETSNLNAFDLIKIGKLFLQKGVWNNERIISEEYINNALTPSIKNHGYGYLWWIFENGFGCRGFGGQEINVFPKESVIVVIQATPTSSNKYYGDICKKILLSNQKDN